MKEKRDILLVISDQHSFAATGFCDSRIDTPEMERIASRGSLFEQAYCSSPLCVPSRMSFLTGMLPSELGIFNNDAALPSDIPTIAHQMEILGYETVLIGRMHFKGDDQKHGFSRRLCGDITSQYWGTGGPRRTDFGPYQGTTNRKHCLKTAGGGRSPVMYYDALVLQETMGYLETWRSETNRRPLFLVVGFYGPHFPFVCEDALFLKYRERISKSRCEEEKGWPSLSVYEELRQETTGEHMRDCQAAYFGLTEMLDRYVGQIYDCFQETSGERPHVFAYTSDHGEQLGRRGIFGKQSFYEESVHVPLILAGTDIPEARFRRPVSLLELPEMLSDIARGAGSFFENDHEKSLSRWLRMQQMLTCDGEPVLAEAAVNGRYKVIRERGCVHVFDLETDPGEAVDLMAQDGARREEARCQAALAWEAGCFLPDEEAAWLVRQEVRRRTGQQLMKAWGEAVHPTEWATVKILPGTLVYPQKSKQ